MKARTGQVLCLLGIALLFAAGIAYAAIRPLTITLTPPTTYTDNSPIAAGDITGYSIVCTFTPTGGAAEACTLANATIPAGVTTSSNSITYPDVGGQMCLALITVTALHGVSETSSSSCRALPAVSNPGKRPRPVQGLTIIVGPAP
jgi:hypothetical protein